MAVIDRLRLDMTLHILRLDMAVTDRLRLDMAVTDRLRLDMTLQIHVD